MAKKKYMKGGKLMVFVSNNAINLATSCKVDESASLIDPETKDDSIFQQVDPDGNRWTVQCDFQLDEDMDNYKALFNVKKAHTAILVSVAPASNYSDNGVDATQSGQWEFAGKKQMVGMAYITSLSMQGDKGSKATGSVTFSGCTRLTNMAVDNIPVKGIITSEPETPSVIDAGVYAANTFLSLGTGVIVISDGVTDVQWLKGFQVEDGKMVKNLSDGLLYKWVETDSSWVVASE